MLISAWINKENGMRMGSNHSLVILATHELPDFTFLLVKPWMSTGWFSNNYRRENASLQGRGNPVLSYCYARYKFTPSPWCWVSVTTWWSAQRWSSQTGLQGGGIVDARSLPSAEWKRLLRAHKSWIIFAFSKLTKGDALFSWLCTNTTNTDHLKEISITEQVF